MVQEPEQSAKCQQLRHRSSHDQRVPAPGGIGQVELAPVDQSGRYVPRTTVVPRTAAIACHGPRHPRLDTRSAGSQAQGRHPVPALAGIPSRPSGRLPVQLVLRSLSHLAGQTGRSHAPGSPGGREAVRGLSRTDSAGNRPWYRGNPRRTNLCGGSGGIELHIRRGHLEQALPDWIGALPDWIGSHVCAFGFLGGVPELVVPDNLRSGVSKAHRYEPDINPTRTWPPTAAWRSCPPGPASPATKPKWRTACW